MSKLLDASGTPILTPRDTAKGLVVPFRSGRHLLEVGTALRYLHKEIEEGEIKTFLAESLDDIADTLERYIKNGGTILATDTEAQAVMAVNPNKLDLV